MTDVVEIRERDTRTCGRNQNERLELHATLSDTHRPVEADRPGRTLRRQNGYDRIAHWSVTGVHHLDAEIARECGARQSHPKNACATNHTHMLECAAKSPVNQQRR
jgi:hypothetical protein